MFREDGQKAGFKNLWHQVRLRLIKCCPWNHLGICFYTDSGIWFCGLPIGQTRGCPPLMRKGWFSIL